MSCPTCSAYIRLRPGGEEVRRVSASVVREVPCGQIATGAGGRFQAGVNFLSACGQLVKILISTNDVEMECLSVGNRIQLKWWSRKRR